MGTELSTGGFETSHAHRPMMQPCKGFGHKMSSAVERDKGSIGFEIGKARLGVSDRGLQCTVTGAAAVERLQAIIDNHPARFAFREDFTRTDRQRDV
ncbi:DUF2218 domain-containing protein [Paracoccus benzoatiresistens]|uniref:DUF2218 domain-containing protein n=1 Tax=Paracoccus benzoatiresistens TaxID=2997341 RepID=A0ABT4J2N5_9RHOB|nr:DUF2218 domain-containing protein [Paracoccus sp. EF6]MCZ0961363.1 DUF2218 domain-containing protein [Paracoccus sp. EF6]